MVDDKEIFTAFSILQALTSLKLVENSSHLRVMSQSRCQFAIMPDCFIAIKWPAWCGVVCQLQLMLKM